MVVIRNIVEEKHTGDQKDELADKHNHVAVQKHFVHVLGLATMVLTYLAELTLDLA